MSTGFDPTLDFHARALSLQSQRLNTVASNLANADTPGYKARDIDFKAALSQVTQSVRLESTHAAHQAPQAPVSEQLKYRVPFQPSQDGNTVETELEQARFAESTVAYQTSLTLLGRRLQGIRTAITGGQ